MVSPRHFKVVADVSADDVTSVRKGMQAQVTPAGATDPVYGTVTDVGLVAEVGSSGAATFPVTVSITGPQSKLYVGTTATVSIITKQVSDVLAVPTLALHTSGSTTYVEKLVGENKVRTTVKVGETYGRTKVTSGLKSGDKVVLATLKLPSGNGNRSATRLPWRRRGQLPRRWRGRRRTSRRELPGARRLHSGGQAVSLIELAGVRKTYDTGDIQVDALRGVDARIEEGEYVAITGPRGSGKSTLMHILGCLDVPTSGTYQLAGEDVSAAQRGPSGRGPQPADRVRLPAVQPAAEPDRVAQRRAPPRVRRDRAPRARERRALAASRGRPRRPRRAPARRALRRPAAARRRRPGPRHRAGADPRGRADRQPRLGVDRRRARRSSTSSPGWGAPSC